MSKIILIFMFIFNNLFGFDDFEYRIEVSSNDVVIKESVILLVDLKQKNIDDVMQLDLYFEPDDAYIVELIESKDSKDAKGRTYVKSQYLLYPLKEGEIQIEPKLIIKKASKEELKKFVTGSADELMYLKTRNKKIDLKPIILTVKGVDNDISLFGDYKLTYKINKKSISSNEQINIEYVLSGYGYKPEVGTLLGNIKNVDIFMDRELFNRKLFHKITYMYALKTDNDFIIPEISIVGYNPKLKKLYILKTPSIKISVQKAIDNDILSKEDSYDFDWKRYLNYLFLFIAGFFLQKLLKHIPKKSLSKDEIFIKTVEKSKTPKDLLRYLNSQKNRKYKSEIEQLEMMIYQDREYKLSSIKSSIIKRFDAVLKKSI